MRKKKVEGEYQTDSWPKGPEWSLCPLARPDIAMALESQIEAWSAHRSESLKTSVSHCQFASIVRRTATVSTSITTGHHHRDEHTAGRRGGLGCQDRRHRGRERYTLDIPLHRRNLWSVQNRAQNRVQMSLHSVGMTGGGSLSPPRWDGNQWCHSERGRRPSRGNMKGRPPS